MVAITNLTRGTILAQQGQWAATLFQRTIGLLARRSLGQDEALVIPHCQSIHTWGMRFPIDVVFVNRAGYVVKTVQRVTAFRIIWALGAHTVIELPAGTLAKRVTKQGELLKIEELKKEVDGTHGL